MFFPELGSGDLVVEKTERGWIATAIKGWKPSLFVPSSLARSNWSWLWDEIRIKSEDKTGLAQIMKKPALSVDDEILKVRFEELTRAFYPDLEGPFKDEIKQIANIVMTDTATADIFSEIQELFKWELRKLPAYQSKLDYSPGFERTEAHPVMYWPALGELGMRAGTNMRIGDRRAEAQ